MADDVTLKAVLVGEDRSLSKTMKGAGEEIEDVGKKSKRTSEEIEGVGKKSKIAGGVMLGVLGSQIASGAVDSLAELVGEAARATDQTDKFKQTLSFAGFKNSAIKQATKDAQAYADATVYDLGTIQNTTAQLAANGVKDYSGLTQAVGNLNAVSGGSADTFKSVAMMLTQTAGAGKLTTENWNQLADAIPGASGVLQDQMRKNGAFTGDFREAMAKGKITSAEFNKAIMQLGNKPVAVAAAKSTKTFEGAIGNLQAVITGHLAKAIDSVKPTLVDLTNGFSDVIDKLGEFPGWVEQNKGALTALGVAVGILAAGYIALAAAQGVSSAAAAVQAAGGIIGFLKAWAAQQAVLNVVMSANPIALIVIAIAALVAGVIVAYNNVEWFRDGVNSAFQAIGAVGRWLWNNALAPALRGIVNGFAWVVDGIANFLDALGNVPGFGWAKAAATSLRGVAQSARDAADGIADIPDPDVDTGKSDAEIKKLKASINGIKGKIVQAKAKGDTKEVDRLNKKLRDMKKKYDVAINLRKTGVSSITSKVISGGIRMIARRMGGPVRKGMPYWVGEDEPELFIPDTNGMIRNQRQLAGSAAASLAGGPASGGSTSVLINLQGLPAGPRAFAEAIERELYGLMRSRGPGGKLTFQRG